MKINAIGSGFSHAYSSTWWKKSKYIEWIHNNLDDNLPTFHIDNSIKILLNQNIKNKFAWLLESNSIFNSSQLINDNLINSYELIFTHNKEYIDKNPNKFKFIPANGFWIEKPKIYDKTKLLSLITSNKKMTIGHKLRFEIIEKYKNNMDLYGRGFKEIKLKEEGLCDYMFSFAIENDKYDDYFTEKILDCFATGTIPIYWGTNNIINYFNKDGIIKYEDFDINMLKPEFYYDNLKAINDNFERVLEYEIPEDIIYKKYLCKYE